MTADTVPKTRALDGFLKEFASRRLLVVGDVILDTYTAGEILRISPEAPIAILNAQTEKQMPGGAANVALNIAALGATVSLVSVVGKDEASVALQKLLEPVALVRCFLLEEDGRLTPSKQRFLAQQQHILRVDREQIADISPASRQKLREEAASLVAAADAVILSDYGKGVLTPDVLRAFIEAARTAQKPVVVDPKGQNYGLYEGACVITPNRKELSAAVGAEATLHKSEELAAAADAVLRKTAVDYLLVTRSEEGMSLYGRKDGRTEERLHIYPFQTAEVVDVSGAGDTVVAVVGLVLSSGTAYIEEAVRLANIAAGIVIRRLGVASVTAETLHRHLEAQSLSQHQQKEYDLPQLLEKRAHWGQTGLRVGFTNGCFDLLHPGHISLLTQAKAACDKLIVALNTDASVRRLKGAGRPVTDQRARAIVLNAIGCVDAVILFEDDTPLSLIEALEPDVLIKGGDYTEETVVGAQEVRRTGGGVLIVKTVEGFSTTKTLQSLRRP